MPVIRAKLKNKQIIFIEVIPKLNHNKNPDNKAPITPQLNAKGPSIFKSLKGRSTSKKVRFLREKKGLKSMIKSNRAYSFS
jgi:hypothetical protein